jgi:hypothetical protein
MDEKIEEVKIERERLERIIVKESKNNHHISPSKSSMTIAYQKVIN